MTYFLGRVIAIHVSDLLFLVLFYQNLPTIMSFLEQAEQLLHHIKVGKPTRPLETQLAGMDYATLVKGLSDDDKRKAFWINIYNAYYLLLRQLNWERPHIFEMKLIPLAGKRFSLDDIEHGILRRFRAKWAAGFLPSPFYRLFLYQLALDQSDFRIHFALNCGAESCPPICFYHHESIDEELNMATQSFLQQETKINRETVTLHVSQLLQWYLGDFGGYGGLRKLLYDNLELEARPWRLQFRPYDWTERLYNFQD